MPRFEGPGDATLVVAALLLLGLAYTGYWIVVSVEPGDHPFSPWFLVAAAVIVVLGILAYVRRGRDKSDP